MLDRAGPVRSAALGITTLSYDPGPGGAILVGNFARRDGGTPPPPLGLSPGPPRPTSGLQAAAAVDGCAAQGRCPVYAEQVSDHCPVVITLER